MAYGRRAGARKYGKRTVRSKPFGRKSAPRVPRVKKPRRPKMRRPARNQMVLSKLCTTVAKLSKQAFGYPQLSRQYFVHDTDIVHPVGTTEIYDLCAEQPVAWCHQAITERSLIYQCKYNSQVIPASWNVTSIGSWAKQPFFPVVSGGASLIEYDSQLFWQNSANSAGVKVENKFRLGTVGYNINLTGVGITGFVELCMVYEKNVVEETQTTQMPSSLRSFVNTVPLSNDQNVASARFWKVQVLKRHYFATTAITGIETNAPTGVHTKAQFHHTYPQKNWHLSVKSGNVLTISDKDSLGGIINYKEIPIKQRSWLMFRTSVPENDITLGYAPGGVPTYVNPGSNPSRRISLSIQKTVSWRDSTGASS